MLSGFPVLAARVRAVSAIVGSTAAPFDSWLVLRGVRTLPVRMRQIGQDAAAAVTTARTAGQFLLGRPRVRLVHYPGLPCHPDHEPARRRVAGFGCCCTRRSSCTGCPAAGV